MRDLPPAGQPAPALSRAGRSRGRCPAPRSKRAIAGWPHQVAPSTRPTPLARRTWMHRRPLVIASRTMLLMMLIAAIALIGLGIFTLARTDAPEVDGWLRSIFGQVFGVIAIGLGLVLGAPGAVGLWAMAGATKSTADPALSEMPRKVLAGIGISTVIIAAVILVATGSAVVLLNLALVALVALASLGLAGAVTFSPHRGRAIVSGIALCLVSLGTLRLLAAAFLR